MIRSIWRALKRDGKRRAEQNADKILSFKSDQTRRANVKLNFTDMQLLINDNFCRRSLESGRRYVYDRQCK